MYVELNRNIVSMIMVCLWYFIKNFNLKICLDYNFINIGVKRCFM